MVLVALYIGRSVFVPVALALLFSVALVPVTNRLQRIGFPRLLAVALVLMVAVGAIMSFMVFLAGQVLKLVADLPRHEATLRDKIVMLSDGSGVFDRAMQTLHRLGQALNIGPRGEAPRIVAEVPQQSGGLSSLLDVLGMVLSPIASVAIALLLVAYLLIQREDVRDRFLHLAGTHDLHRSTRAMTDATDRVGRYLLMQVGVNGAYGLLMGAGLSVIGVPNAALWGVLCFLLRFVPFIGGAVAILFPLTLAFATTPGWTAPVEVLLLYVLVGSFCTYVIEPLLYSSSTGISPLALLLSSAIWTVLWGPVGLILAPPITTCIVILGRLVPAFGFLEVLLGDRQPLPPSVRFYQRYLAEDPFGAEQIADGYMREKGMAALLRDLVLPMLETLRHDRRGGLLRADALPRITDGLTALLDDLQESTEVEPETPRIAVLPVAGALDRAAAATVAAALRDGGRALALGEATEPVAATVLCMVDVPSVARLRRLVLQARRNSGTVVAMILGDVTQAQLAPLAVLEVPLVRRLDDLRGPLDAAVKLRPRTIAA
ncbi:putative PurR-regulated permease PerM [Humitalea rosea]|uniref:Putative PurR-regulated permease PerM n=2 Tax=Humitalea rosea TaxID=990373 RepID=A0A2W7IUJ3_9PROT|nr:putative PurR-regulated permease PerM [Humitalea rosea]